MGATLKRVTKGCGKGDSLAKRGLAKTNHGSSQFNGQQNSGAVNNKKAAGGVIRSPAFIRTDNEEAYGLIVVQIVTDF